MKVEFYPYTTYGDGGFLKVNSADFKKAKNDDNQYQSFAFATHSFFMFYGIDQFISLDEYKYICTKLENNGAVIFSVYKERPYSPIYYPIIFVSNDNVLHQLYLEDAYLVEANIEKPNKK